MCGPQSYVILEHVVCVVHSPMLYYNMFYVWSTVLCYITPCCVCGPQSYVILQHVLCVVHSPMLYYTMLCVWSTVLCYITPCCVCGPQSYVILQHVLCVVHSPMLYCVLGEQGKDHWLQKASNMNVIVPLMFTGTFPHPGILSMAVGGLHSLLPFRTNLIVIQHCHVVQLTSLAFVCFVIVIKVFQFNDAHCFFIFFHWNITLFMDEINLSHHGIFYIIGSTFCNWDICLSDSLRLPLTTSVHLKNNWY